MRELVELGVIRGDTSVFDYGCGYGTDVEWLRSMGIKVDGWDLYHYRGKIQPADIVTLLFVLNVIADVQEREWVLYSAYSLAQQRLVISIAPWAADVPKWTPYGDGYLTNWRTFEKIYQAEETKNYLRAVLGIEPYPLCANTYGVSVSPKAEPILAYSCPEDELNRHLMRLTRKRSRLKKQGWIPASHVKLEKQTYYRFRSPYHDIPNPDTGELTNVLHLGKSGTERWQWAVEVFQRKEKLTILNARIAYIRNCLKQRGSYSDRIPVKACPVPGFVQHLPFRAATTRIGI